MLIVTGMHRSGTSAISAVLAQLGLNFGPEDEHLPPDQWNARGYFEHKRIFAVNSRIITGAGSSVTAWYVPAHERTRLQQLEMTALKARYLMMPSSDILSRRAKRMRATLQAIGNEMPEIIAKDPRFCLLLESWTHYVPIQRVLFCYRSPAAVIRSLQARERIPQWLGYRFWCYHITAFIEQAGRLNIPTYIVSYDRLFAPDSSRDEAKTLFRFAGIQFDQEQWEKAVSGALDRSLRHQSADETVLPARVAELDEQLRQVVTRSDSDRQ